MTDRKPFPIATLLIIAANIATAFVLLFQPDLVNKFGFNPAQPSFLTAFTSLFMHVNVLHLLGNMLFLAAVGPAVEAAAGSGRFSAVYLVGGFAGVAAHFAMSDRSLTTAVPLIGASGCVSACIAYYSLRYIHLRVSLAPSIQVPVFAMIGIWLALQIGGAFLNLGGTPAGTAYWAHLGGFGLGILLGLVFRAPIHAHKEVAFSTVKRMNYRSPAAKLAAADIVLQHYPDDVAALHERADALSLLNEPDDEAATLMKLLDLVPENEQPPVAIRLDHINRLDRLPSRQRIILAQRLKGASPEACRALLMSVIRVMTDPERPDALFALAAIDFELEPDLAKRWIGELQKYPMHPAMESARARGWVR